MAIAKKIEAFLSRSSWIRKMFEEGARLKQLHGAENVFDFSLGNPNLPPPAEFNDALKRLAADAGPGRHAYMPNAGFPEVRAVLAEQVSQEQSTTVSAEDLVMTCGAAGALNIIFKTLLDPGDVVLTPAPYFVEYHFYADNHGGVLHTVPTRSDFTLDLEAVAAAVGERTKAVLINSPNNPTGQIYSAESLQALSELLHAKSREFGHTIYLIADEPYRKIVYGPARVPGIFEHYSESVIATSFSKDISIPGERIGFAAVHPQAAGKADLLAGMSLANRILGFVNAPAFMQRAVAMLAGAHVDIAAYARKRRLLCDGLAECGYRFVTPPGAFYIFPRTPIADDVAFVKALQEEFILAVPGSGFGGPGHFRIAFCVDDETIINAMPGFKRTLARF